MIEERISKQQLEKLYSVDRATIKSWVDNYGLPMVMVTSHSQYVRKADLLHWEQTKMKNKIEL